MDIAAGQWAVLVDGVELAGVEAAEPNVDQETVEITGLNGVKYKRTKSRSAEVVLTVFDTGIENLKKILPSNWVDQATQIEGQPTGVVAKAGGGEVGAITYGKPACGVARLLVPLQLVPCDDPDQHTVTLFDGYAEITGMPFDDGVLKYEITVSSEATGVQLAKGAITFPEES